MDLVVKLLELFPRLLSIVSDSDITLLIGVGFTVAVVVSIFCYCLWGRY